MNRNLSIITITLSSGAILTFFLFFLINYYQDPYNFNKTQNIFEDTHNEAFKFNERLFKLKNFKNNPSENIIIGNSVVDDIDVKNFKRFKISKLCYGGASVKEIYQTFLYITDHYKISNVILGVSFGDYNAEKNEKNLDQTLKFINNKWFYYFNYDISKISLKIISNKLSNKKLENSNQDEDAWNRIYNFQEKYYNNFSLSETKLKYLDNIIRLAKNKNINLIIVVPPIHNDLLKIIKNLSNRNYILNFSKTINKNKINIIYLNNDKFNNDKLNFVDPLHLSDLGLQKLSLEIEKNLIDTNYSNEK